MNRRIPTELLLLAPPIAAATLVALGLIYAREYMSALGIPESEWDLSLWEYALVSTDQAIAYLVIVSMLAAWAYFSRNWPRPSEFSRRRFVLGIAACTLALIVQTLMVLTGFSLREIFVSNAALILTGVILCQHAFPSSATDETQSEGKNLLSLSRGTFAAVMILPPLLAIALSTGSESFARDDATRLREEAPLVQVYMEGAKDGADCEHPNVICDHRLLFFGEYFTYLLPSGDSGLTSLAIPTDAILRVEHLRSQ